MAHEFNRQAAGSGTWFMSQMMAGVAFAGTGTKQEITELENNLRQLLQSKMFPYSYIEDYLMGCNYRQDMIRKLFTQITGLSPHDFLRDDAEILTVPAAIPSYNLGWGVSKAKKFDFYFIMPWVSGYSIFAQKGELDRSEIKNFLVLEDAREELKQLVKEYRQHDKVVDLDVKKETDCSSFSEPRRAALSTEGKSIDDYLSVVSAGVRTEQANAYIKDAYFNGLISADDFQILSNRYLKAAEANALQDAEDRLAASTVSAEIKESSPQAYFENQTSDTEVTNVTPLLDKIHDYLAKKSAAVSPDFKFSLVSFKYKSVDKYESNEKNVSTSTSRPLEFLSSTGVVSVVLLFTSAELPADGEGRYGLMVFSILDGDLQTTGNFKGSDGKLYALDREGVSKYFADALTQKQKSDF